MRDYIFQSHKEGFYSLICGVKPPLSLPNQGFPPIRLLIQRSAEIRINYLVDRLKSLTLDGKEVRLISTGESTTRVDLIGRSVEGGELTLIELKNSAQTERQAFTELLAYANHFCLLFPPLNETNINSILVAPMDGRAIRDAYVQELLINHKPVIALIPDTSSEEFKLRIYYPPESSYRWMENKIFDDKSFCCVVASFPEIEGWIDTDKNNNGSIPKHSEEALNAIAFVIAQKLESLGLHGFVYGRQYWGELVDVLPYPNGIVVSVLNPFSNFRNSIEEEVVSDDTPDERISNIQAFFDQISKKDNDWLENLESNFHNKIIRIVREGLEIAFLQKGVVQDIETEISLPEWVYFKISMIEAVTCHNLNLVPTDLVREIYQEYIRHIYHVGYDNAFYHDDIPMFSYETLNNFLAVWEILRHIAFDAR